MVHMLLGLEYRQWRPVTFGGCKLNRNWGSIVILINQAVRDVVQEEDDQVQRCHVKSWALWMPEKTRRMCCLISYRWYRVELEINRGVQHFIANERYSNKYGEILEVISDY